MHEGGCLKEFFSLTCSLASGSVITDQLLHKRFSGIERLRLVTSFIKCLKNTCEIVFTDLVVEILQLVHKIAVSPKFSIKEAQNTSVQRNVSNFTDEHKKQSSGGVLAKENVLKNFANSQKNLFSGVSFLIKLQAGNLKPSEATTGKCSVKQGALKNFTGKNLCWGLFLIKLHSWCLQLHQRRLWHRCFVVKFAIILKNIGECLLVNVI